MKKRGGYIFTNKRHHDRGIMSAILGVIADMSLVAVIYLTYIQEGIATRSYGLTGLLVLFMSLVGLWLGIVEVKNKDCYKLFPVAGIVLNLIALAGVALIIYAGVYI